MNAFSGINMLGQTLRAYQQGLDVTGHNISNLNTTGYSRQTIQYGQLDPETFWGINHGYQVGNGVGVSGVYRSRDQFLDGQSRLMNSEIGRYGTLSNSANQIAGIIPEPNSEGISDALNAFFDGWSALSSNPGDSASRLQVKLAAESLTSRVRTTYGELQTLDSSTAASVQGQLSHVDVLGSKIAELNQKIVAAQASGSEPGDLLDQRDLALNELSSIVSVQTYVSDSGAMRVYTGEFALVDGSTSFAIPKSYDVATGTLTDGSKSYTLTSGSVLGTLQASQSAQDLMAKLDTLANTLRTQVNTLHATGVNSDGDTGINFFNDATPQTGAADFDLSDDVKASAEAIMSGTSGKAGDGGLALSLSRLRDQSISTLGDKSISGYYQEVLATVGRDTSSYSQSLDTAMAVSTQINDQIQSVSGVNLDEEMTNLLRFQRSYQAAAKALSVLSDVTEDLVNLIR